MTAARELFLQHGFERTTVQQIADAADVAVQTLFNHASSKEALFFLGRVPFADALSRPTAPTDGDGWADSLVEHLTDLTVGYLRSLDDPDNLAMAAQIEDTPVLRRYERTLHTEAERQLAVVVESRLPGADARLAAAVLLATTRAHAHRYRQLLISGADTGAALARLVEVLPRHLAAVLAVARSG